MLIWVDKHPELLGLVRLGSTLAAAGAALVAEVVPTLPVPNLDEGSIDAALEMDLDAPIRLCEHKCPRVLPRQAPTLQEVRRMHSNTWRNHEKPPWELCDRRGLCALDCRTDGPWDDIACHYGPYLLCLDLRSGQHAARLNTWMNTAIHPKNTEPHYRQGSHVLPRRLDEANVEGFVASRRCASCIGTYTSSGSVARRTRRSTLPSRTTTVSLLGVGHYGF